MSFKKGDELSLEVMNTGLFEAVIVENDEQYLDVEYRLKVTGVILTLEETKQVLKTITKAV